SVQFKLVVTGGQPGSEVSQVAREREVDLVVMAWQGGGGAQHHATRGGARASGWSGLLGYFGRGRRRRCQSGLPIQEVCMGDGPDAVIFDLDGVITFTARVHAAAWKELFDDYLRSRAERIGIPFRPFDAAADYYAYVDGKPRYDGVQSFLKSR